MKRQIITRPGRGGDPLRRAFQHLGYEVIPFKSARAAVLAHVPRDVPLTVTAHLSAQQVTDRAHLAGIVARCQEAGITSAFVVGGDRTSTSTEFQDAHDLLSALHEVGHGFTDIGIAGHPEGHPEVPDEALFAALKQKAPLATHIKTQMVFDPKVIARWAQELVQRGIDLPVYVGIPGAVSRQKLLRVSGSLGLGDSARFLRKQQSLFWRFFLPGGYSPDKIIEGLAPHFGDPGNRLAGFHVFTFNDLEPTEAWRQQMGVATTEPERT